MRFFYFVFLTLIWINVFAQPKVYINLNAHNEVSGNGELPYDQLPGTNYTSIYPYIKQIADSVISKNAKWNFQSDVRMLLGAIKFDPKNSSTNNKNLLKWMDDSPNIECDPHSHESVVNGSTYNYADVAHLHDSLGMTNRRNVGGFKIDGLQNGSDWQSFEAGMACAKFTSAPKWKPYTMWGGSYSAGVHNDVNLYGSYKPQSRANYTVHVSTNRLAEQGNGCEAHFTDTTDVNRVVNNLKSLFTNVHNGTYPSTEFYTQSIQIDCRDFMKPNFISRLCVILDTVNHYVAKGWVEWKTITEKDLYWRTSLDSVMKYTTCSNLPSGINDSEKINNSEIYPNPGKAGIFTINSDIKPGTSINVTDVLGKQSLLSYNISSNNSFTLDLTGFKNGIYFVHYTDLNSNIRSRKLVIE